MTNFEEYIQGNDLLANKDKVAILRMNPDEEKRMRIMEVIRSYESDVRFQKSVLESMELASMSMVSDFIKNEADEVHAKKLMTDLEYCLHII